MHNHWTDTFYYNVIYVIVIFTLKKFMQNRQPYKMKIPVVTWNIILATFSVMGTVRTMPDLIYSLSHHGIHHSICDQSFVVANEVTRPWVFFFVISKVFELLDTVFVVLRKHPLIFLHWYHHISVLFYCWLSYRDSVSTSRWFVVMNLFVHSLMYTYYAVRCLNFKLPKQVSILITTLQILQMFIAFLVNIYVFWQIQQGNECTTPISNVIISSIIYLSYFILFARFFRKAYLSKRKSNKNE